MHNKSEIELQRKLINFLTPGYCPHNSEKEEKNFIDFAIKQGVAAYLYKKIYDNCVDVDLNNYAKWKKAYVMNYLVYQQKVKAFTQIQTVLQKANIPFLALKGFALAHSQYSDGGVRPMGDIDLLVADGKGIEAMNILVANGATYSVIPRSWIHEQNHAHVRALFFNGVMIEIHQRLFHRGSKFNLKNINLLEKSTSINFENLNINMLNDTYMCYHLVAHASHGISMGGIRICWLLDVALLWSKYNYSADFRNKVINCNPKQKKQLNLFFDITSLIIPEKYRDKKINEQKKDELLAFISSLAYAKDLEKKHKLLNMKEIIQTPGIINKMLLFFYEFFPSKKYMQYKYNTNKNVYGLYFKRILNSLIGK